MNKIEEISVEKIQEMKKYYDPLIAGICIQKYLETEDGRGDFVPVYANQTFADNMGVPIEMVTAITLRQASQGFPEERFKEMVDVAFDGRVIIGDTFSMDYSKFFSVRIYQYSYGYTIMFMSDVTMGHINAYTLDAVSRAYERIYFASLNENVCSRVYPATEEIETQNYTQLIELIKKENIIHSEDILKVDVFLQKVKIQGLEFDNDSVSMRFRGLTTEDKYEWYSIEIIKNEKSEGQPVTFVITIKNIENLVKEEKQKQAELEEAFETVKRAKESKDKFLAHMSHDLRTPLNGILGMLQILEGEDAPEEVKRRYINNMKKSTESLLTLFNEVLDITRLDSSNIMLERKAFDFRHISDTIDALEKKYGNLFTVRFNEMQHPIRIGAEEYISQILIQLASNAAKFNKDNNPIYITIKEVDNSDIIIIYVQDNGIGMSQEFQEHIYEPFAQEHSDARTTFQGAGLGMTYLKRIVEELDGFVCFESIEGEGSTFEVRLPVEICDEGFMEAIDKNKEVELNGRHALIVEDNEINALVAEQFLVKEDVTTDFAENGQVGFEKFLNSSKDEYDFILMDIMMPVMNGLEATAAIRACDHPRAKTIPIIAVSANSFPEDIQKGLEAGVNDYIAKPIGKVELIEIIKKNL